MAQTYTLATTGVTFALNKSLLGFFNGVGSNRIVRLYRVYILNNQVTAVTGTATFLELRRITTGSGGTAIAPVKHDSTNENFPPQIVVASNLSFTNSDLLISKWWSTDEPAPMTTSIDEMHTIPSLNLIWDVAYSGTSVEPIVCREGYGISLNTTTSLVGLCDVIFEVTLASS